MNADNQQLKVFISHHHGDAKALTKIQERLKEYYIDAFIAHKDIEIGEHDLERIQTEIKSCDIFLLIGNKNAQQSEFVNQEIGIALGRKKTIISSTICNCNPWGFIARQQAIKYQSIDDHFFNKLIKELGRQALKVKKEHYLSKKNHALSIWGNDLKLVFDNWNDYGFKTLCTLENDSGRIADIQIAHANFPDSENPEVLKNHPTRNNSIREFLPEDFLSKDGLSFLDKNFFSYVEISEDIELSEEKQTSIQCLFNDIREDVLDKELVRQYARKSVTEVSLFRNKKDEYKNFLKKNKINK